MNAQTLAGMILVGLLVIATVFSIGYLWLSNPPTLPIKGVYRSGAGDCPKVERNEFSSGPTWFLGQPQPKVRK